MPELHDFIFSSQNLQDFLDCERRFELKYLLRQSWPAPRSEPVLEVERRIRIGRDFHAMIHQYLSGISITDLLRMDNHPEINNWLPSFVSFFEQYCFFLYHSEIPVMLPFQEHYLTAVFDLIGSTEDNRVIIADWKTSHFPPKKARIIKTVQSFLYPYMAYETAEQLFNQMKLNYHSIEMVFWNAVYPSEVVTLNYSKEQHKENKDRLSEMIHRITRQPLGKFDMTADTWKCDFCQYRSLCQRGIKAGLFDQSNELDMEDLFSDISMDDFNEISF